MKIASGIDTFPLLLEIHRHPELWNKNPCRLSEVGPHHETQDMFLRYKDEKENRESNDWKNFSAEHIPVWNKTIDFLPSAKPLIYDLMHRVKSDMLGGVFVYKIEPGKQIYPHIDKGWHPDFYEKFNICLQSNNQTRFFYENEAMIQQAGDVHVFKNDVTHWVKNEGSCDHIILTVCLKLDKGERVDWSPEGWTFDNSMKSLNEKVG